VKSSAYVVAPLARIILSVMCRIDRAELKRIPRKGPLILVTNHINFLEAPLLYSFLYPRDIAGFAKSETWRTPFLGLLARIWECVPVDREANDMGSMRRALEALERGRILNVMPEGTRSHDGRLQRGHEGVVAMALRSGAPLVPVAHFGGEEFWRNIRRGKRTRVHIRVGESFHLRQPEPGRAKTARAEAAEEIMLRLAALLPPEYRGAYRDRVPTSRQLIPARA
jgi:1-acyl-sn-glycerol-3-phosphate acyltransferase